MAGTWTAERRAAQAARARASRPWTKSTGPKTAAGKARVACNALKTGVFTAAIRTEMRAIRAFLRLNRELVATYKAMCAAEQARALAEQQNRQSGASVGVDAADPCPQTAAARSDISENPENKVKAAASADPGAVPPAGRQEDENEKPEKQTEAGRPGLPLSAPRGLRREGRRLSAPPAIRASTGRTTGPARRQGPGTAGRRASEGCRIIHTPALFQPRLPIPIYQPRTAGFCGRPELAGRGSSEGGLYGLCVAYDFGRERSFALSRRNQTLPHVAAAGRIYARQALARA